MIPGLSSPFLFGGGADPNTLLLLHCNGADASTSFPDASRYARTVQANSTAQVDTAQFKFGTASALFNGVADSLTVGSSADFALNDFTFETQLRFNSIAAAGGLFSDAVDETKLFCDWTTSNNLRFQINNSTLWTFSWTPSANTWYHVAFTRSGSSLRAFVDGTQVGTTKSESGNPGTIGLTLGNRGDGLESLNGWMDEIRVSNIARWTANFTAPTAPY